MRELMQRSNPGATESVFGSLPNPGVNESVFLYCNNCEYCLF